MSITLETFLLIYSKIRKECAFTRDYRIRGPSYCKPTKSYYSTSARMRCNGVAIFLT
jgi:hypothetical protein